MYKIVFAKEAYKQYDKLPKTAKPKVERAVNKLSKNPLVGKKLKGRLKDLFSLRVWPYRIIYQITRRPKTVVVITIIHRQQAYR